MSGEKLPNAHLARVEEAKLRDYLLNLEHPKGQPKATYFRRRGFSPGEWEAFAGALRQHARNNPVSRTKRTPYATNYSLDCHLPTPDRSNPCIRTVWEVTEDGSPPRLITAHPLE